VALLALVGCGSSGGTESSSAAAKTTAGSAAPQSSGALRTADSSLGRIVVDGKGMTAYYFTKDKPGSGTSACTGECLATWPAITTTAATPSATGVTGKVGTITRPDGSKQLTVDGRPVYTYSPDTQPGDVKGQGVAGLWYVLRPDGTMVTDQSSGGSGSGGY
jgi:predicted lipoprotein with Yx(FWY)xxD motif